MIKRTRSELAQLQGLPLSVKIKKTQQRIREWVDEFGEDGVYISFSGGKDSTVLLDIVRKMYPDVEAVYCDTGIEYTEIRKFVKGFENVVWLKPKKPMVQIIREYGYPLISKEVSEAVEGARKYLNCVLNATESDRQTDRQKYPYAQFFRKICGIGEYSNTSSKQKNSLVSEDTNRTISQSRAEQSRADRWAILDASDGGLDNKYRKVRGIAEYSHRQCESTKNNRYTSNEWKSDSGDYP